MVKQIYNTIQANIQNLLSNTPRRIWLLIGVGLGVAVLAALLYWPKTVVYAYQKNNCVPHLSVLPGIVNSKSDKFKVSFYGGVSLGDVRLATTQLCVQPLMAPKEGRYGASLVAFGVLPARPVTVVVDAPPVVSRTLLSQPIPVSKPLQVSLSKADEVHSYQLYMDETEVPCTTRSVQVQCDIHKHGLAQGSEYRAKLHRTFGDERVDTLFEASVATLTAASVVDTSIAPDAEVRDKPQQATVVFDKPIQRASARLERVNGEETVAVALTQQVKDERLELSWEQELDRMAQYQLVVDGVEAKDGSALTEPYTMSFRTSGGPKVQSVSVGRTGVALGSTAVITFDQALRADQSLDGVLTATGGATILRKQGAQVFVRLADVPRCGDVSLKLNDELQNEHGAKGGSAWSYQLRMACHTTEVIGYSAKGRAITSYTFGSGASAVVYTGAIHGNEASTRALMLRWIDELEANAHKIPAGVRVVVIPVVNPDGFTAGSRTNANNVDLNRNFGTSDWKKDITTVTNAPFPGGGGATAMSEPETKALAAYIGRIGARLVLSYHSIGGIVAANQAGDSSTRARTYSSLSGYRNTTGSSSTFEYAISGTADDYYAEKLGVPSILIELGSHSYHQFERNQSAMWTMLK